MHAAPARCAASSFLAPCVRCLAFLAVFFAGTAPNSAQTGGAATTGRTFTDTRLNMTVVATEIELPPGRWQVAAPARP